MKKIIILAIAVLFTCTIKAQIVTSKTDQVTTKYVFKYPEPFQDSLRIHYEIQTFIDTSLFHVNPNEDCIIVKDYGKMEDNFEIWIKETFKL